METRENETRSERGKQQEIVFQAGLLFRFRDQVPTRVFYFKSFCVSLITSTKYAYATALPHHARFSFSSVSDSVHLFVHHNIRLSTRSYFQTRRSSHLRSLLSPRHSRVPLLLLHSHFSLTLFDTPASPLSIFRSDYSAKSSRASQPTQHSNDVRETCRISGRKFGES